MRHEIDGIGFEGSPISSAELPVAANIIPERSNRGLYPEDPEEAEAYWDFIAFHMRQEHVVLDYIPADDSEPFFPPHEPDEAISYPFGSADFQRKYPQEMSDWQKQRYARSKTFEKLRDIAETHSCVTNQGSRDNLKQRYFSLVERKMWKAKDKLEALHLWQKVAFEP